MNGTNKQTCDRGLFYQLSFSCRQPIDNSQLVDVRTSKFNATAYYNFCVLVRERSSGMGPRCKPEVWRHINSSIKVFFFQQKETNQGWTVLRPGTRTCFGRVSLQASLACLNSSQFQTGTVKVNWRVHNCHQALFFFVFSVSHSWTKLVLPQVHFMDSASPFSHASSFGAVSRNWSCCTQRDIPLHGWPVSQIILWHIFFY